MTLLNSLDCCLNIFVFNIKNRLYHHNIYKLAKDLYSMVRFFCRRCGFKYKPKTESMEIPKRCGNCGGTGSVAPEPSAEDILRDAN